MTPRFRLASGRRGAREHVKHQADGVSGERRDAGAHEPSRGNPRNPKTRTTLSTVLTVMTARATSIGPRVFLCARRPLSNMKAPA